MAPEVLLSTQNQTNKIDIYSTSLIIWEMWFGDDISNHMNREFLGPDFHGNAMDELKRRVGDPRAPWRPPLRSPNKPPEKLMEMMKRGWNEDLGARPTAEEWVSFFEHQLRKT